MKELNVKFDIREMTEHFNNASLVFGNDLNDITPEQMSEMIQRHAFKLGYTWNSGTCQIIENANYINLHSEVMTYSDIKTSFLNEDLKKMGLGFFSIAPQPKMVTVEMPANDYHVLHEAEVINMSKWKIIK